MRKQFCLFFGVIILLIISNLSVYAKGGNGHNKELEKVLFGEISLTDEQEDAVEALEAAAYLTIDQFGGDGESKLEILEDYKVNNLPTIEEIDISSSETNHHREYTHQGWESNYRHIKDHEGSEDEEWQSKWNERKHILENTANEIFGFKWWGDIPLIGSMLPDYGQQCDSFCALVYYVHILGDHEVTNSVKQYNYLMPVGGKLNQCDIIHELMYHCNILFAAQSNTYEFAMFKTKLSILNSKYTKIGKVTADNIEQNKKYAEELVDILKNYVPSLLGNETFFNEVFWIENVA